MTPDSVEGIVLTGNLDLKWDTRGKCMADCFEAWGKDDLTSDLGIVLST